MTMDTNRNLGRVDLWTIVCWPLSRAKALQVYCKVKNQLGCPYLPEFVIHLVWDKTSNALFKMLQFEMEGSDFWHHTFMKHCQRNKKSYFVVIKWLLSVIVSGDNLKLYSFGNNLEYMYCI